MADSTSTLMIDPRDDRILPLTRAVAFLVIPFLIAAFLILFVGGTQTERWFAWQIPSRLTTALMGSGYLGGAYFSFVWARSAAGIAFSLVRYKSHGICTNC